MTDSWTSPTSLKNFLIPAPILRPSFRRKHILFSATIAAHPMTAVRLARYRVATSTAKQCLAIGPWKKWDWGTRSTQHSAFSQSKSKVKGYGRGLRANGQEPTAKGQEQPGIHTESLMFDKFQVALIRRFARKRLGKDIAPLETTATHPGVLVP